MKLKNMKIGMQLRLSLVSIFLLVAFLGAMAWLQSDHLWLNTKGLYEHPFTVSKALGELKADILSIRLEYAGLILADSGADKKTAIQNVVVSTADADLRFDVIRNNYLGSRADVDSAYNDYLKWKWEIDENIQLIKAGKRAEALINVKNSGSLDARNRQLLSSIDKISDFAQKKSEQFYNDAQKEKKEMKLSLVVLLAAVVIVLVAVGVFLIKNIKDPLKELALQADRFRRGEMNVRSTNTSGNEFGMLSDSFNSLAETIQEELSGRDNSANSSTVLLQEEELRPFCRELLKVLILQTGSQVGAIYLVNEQKTVFEHYDSIGMANGNRASFSASSTEGEFGVALATSQIQHIKDIPEDSLFSLSTVNGDFKPREIITIPILAEQEVVAVISLSGLRSYSKAAMRLVDDLWPVMTARLNGALSLQRVLSFSGKLEQQNRELDAQKREITAQKDEMFEQNVELEMQKNQLDEANRLKSTFLSNMSHELRTPLNSVIALSGVLNRRLMNKIPEEEYSYLEIIERNGRNLLELINDILDLSRIEAGRDEISLSRFSVRSLAAEVVSILEHQAQQKNIYLQNCVHEDLQHIRSDYAKCRHILQNLVSNAVKFTAEGSVEIRAEVFEGAIRISVVDTGIGIAPEKLDYIFEEFRQADESTTKNYGGTGLGLSIARKYAFMLFGSLIAESTPGKGSAFILTLPLKISSSAMPGQPEDKAAIEPQVKSGGQTLSIRSGVGKRVLVVEDNESAIIQVKDVLVEKGYTVQLAKNGREALELIEHELPDAMILDLMMPEVDGFDVLRSIRSVPKTAHIPVLILTAKHVTKEELSFLTSNHIYQLVQKGDVNRFDLLSAVGSMVMAVEVLASAAPPHIAVKPIAGKPNILVVEDNLDNLKTIRALLQDSCTVLEALDGQSGLEMAELHLPDMILMDISMPVMDGYKALDAIKNSQALKHIPVIAVTASAMIGNREEILGRGFDGYVSKPIDWEMLDNIIREKLYGL